MTQVLRINHQLLSDAISVLYSNGFTFCFPARFREDNVNTWLHTIGDKKKLVKRISVCVEAHANLLTWGPACHQQASKLGCLLLKEELVNLTSVEIVVALLPSGVVRDELSDHTLTCGEHEKEILVDMIMDFMGIFPGFSVSNE
jgi:hypothetical protein